MEARQQLRRAIRATSINNEEETMAIFFDGRKDMTLVKEKRGDKWYSMKKIKEHYVMIGEPGTFYLCHLTLERGTGSAIADSIHSSIEEMGITESVIIGLQEYNMARSTTKCILGPSGKCSFVHAWR